MRQETVSIERLQRARRALFEAMANLVVAQRMLVGMIEQGPGGWRPVTFRTGEERVGEDGRSIVDALSRMGGKLDAIDDRLEELEHPAKEEPR